MAAAKVQLNTRIDRSLDRAVKRDAKLRGESTQDYVAAALRMRLAAGANPAAGTHTTKGNEHG